MEAVNFAVFFVTLYVSHHVGDYWVQTDKEARLKGSAGRGGVLHCLLHVLSYLTTQTVFLIIVAVAFGMSSSWWGTFIALGVSGWTHYTADRREHGLMFKIAGLLPGKVNFLKLGAPRSDRDDNPSLGTGAWALDQSWHLVFSVFVPAMILSLTS